jgi:tRNA (guanine-N7-)-methyltransferase
VRLRNKPNLSARIEKCAHLLVTEPGALRGRWLDGTQYGELHIELGCGKGMFTVGTAKSETQIFLAALEKSANALIIALERAAAEGLQNIRFLKAYADDLTEYFAPGEVSRIYLNFCDPWPTNRHAKRRLTSRRFLELYGQVLKPGGELHFKTDNLPLFEYSLREFDRCGLTELDVIYDLHKNGSVGVMTDYEMKFHARGTTINFARIANSG